jgi:hypothetical protein
MGGQPALTVDSVWGGLLLLLLASSVPGTASRSPVYKLKDVLTDS